MRCTRWLAAALAPLLVAGCVMNARLRSDTLGAPGGSPASGHAQRIGGAVQWEGTTLASAIVAAAAVAVIVDATRDGAAPLAMQRGAAPELDPARAIHEQDCTRPIENPSANLRCR